MNTPWETPPFPEDPRDDAERMEDAHRGGHHFFADVLMCDGREHYYPCVFEGCNARQYFCKHLENDRHCPAHPTRRDSNG